MKKSKIITKDFKIEDLYGKKVTEEELNELLKLNSKKILLDLLLNFIQEKIKKKNLYVILLKNHHQKRK